MPKDKVQKLLSTVVANLQATAWSRGVKLIADVTAQIDLDVGAEPVARCVERLLNALLAEAPQGSSVCVVSGLELPEAAPPVGLIKIEISSPITHGDAVPKAMAEVRRTLAPADGSLTEYQAGSTRTLTVSLPGGRAGLTLVSGRTAIVVDDDVDTQEFLAEVLRQRGFRVIAVSDGFDALVAIERHKPDVVLTDIMMPNMSGLDLASRIKQCRADLPVIVFSGYRDVLRRDLDALPDTILSKPMSRADVLKAIDDVLAP